jgi:hypothetical protein
VNRGRREKLKYEGVFETGDIMGAIYSGSANNSRLFGYAFYTPYYVGLEKHYIWLFVYSILGTLFNH